jgi:hypothetical protein
MSSDCPPHQDVPLRPFAGRSHPTLDLPAARSSRARASRDGELHAPVLARLRARQGGAHLGALTIGSSASPSMQVLSTAPSLRRWPSSSTLSRRPLRPGLACECSPRRSPFAGGRVRQLSAVGHRRPVHLACWALPLLGALAFGQSADRDRDEVPQGAHSDRQGARWGHHVRRPRVPGLC